MDLDVKVLGLDAQDIIEDLGLEENGKVQKVVDLTFIHYMLEKMPYRTGGLIRNTRIVEPGLIQVQTPYAHYMNEGILYVDPKSGKGAMFNDSYGYWSRPGVKKVPSSRELDYKLKGANRGAHFVERTITENIDDIIAAAQGAINK